jgi:hypothetical protein
VETQRVTSVGWVLILSALTTAVGTGIAYWGEQQLLSLVDPAKFFVAVGLIEEALVRLAPLIATFYLWSYRRGHLLTKTEGLVATIASGVTVSSLELALKLEYLSELERAVQFDTLVLPVIFIHLPLALVAGRIAYALGERIHNNGVVGLPQLSGRTLMSLVCSYLLLAAAHITYNVTL